MSDNLFMLFSFNNTPAFGVITSPLLLRDQSQMLRDLMCVPFLILQHSEAVPMVAGCFPGSPAETGVIETPKIDKEH